MMFCPPTANSQTPWHDRIWDEMHDLGLTKEGSPRQQSCFTGLMNAAAATGWVEKVMGNVPPQFWE